MRITARFDTVDEAEFAASALRMNPGVFDATVRELKRDNGSNNSPKAPIGFFTNVNTAGALGLPVPFYGTDSSDKNNSTEKTAIVDVICRSSSAQNVSSTLLSKGGHDLKGSG